MARTTAQVAGGTLVIPAQGATDAALYRLDDALALAAPEGFIRIFVDEGPPMAALLRAATQHGTARH